MWQWALSNYDVVSINSLLVHRGAWLYFTQWLLVWCCRLAPQISLLWFVSGHTHPLLFLYLLLSSTVTQSKVGIFNQQCCHNVIWESWNSIIALDRTKFVEYKYLLLFVRNPHKFSFASSISLLSISQPNFNPQKCLQRFHGKDMRTTVHHSSLKPDQDANSVP